MGCSITIVPTVTIVPTIRAKTDLRKHNLSQLPVGDSGVGDSGSIPRTQGMNQLACTVQCAVTRD